MDKVKALFADVFTSKKALAALATLLVIVLSHLGLPVSEEMMNQILFVVASYLVGQGVADAGKEAAKIKKIVDEEKK